MWQDFSAHHAQRGDVTAIVWGSPGAQASVEHESAAAASGAAGSAPPSDTAAAAAAATASAAASAAGGDACTPPTSRWKVDAEALTRGRRADTPFVQQCDLIFPLADPDVEGCGAGCDDGAGDVLREATAQSEAERQAEAFVTRALGSSFYYRVRGALCDLLREPFLSSCVLKGSFSALALNAPSDQGNSFAILPGGVLVLSLDRESFQTLGLPGEAAPTRPKGRSKRAGAGAGSTGGSVGVLRGGAGGPDRYVSVFDLSSKAFRPGKPLHDRVLASLGGGRRGDKEGDGNDDADDSSASAAASAAATAAAAAAAAPAPVGRGVGVVDMVVCWWGGGESDKIRGGGAEAYRAGSVPGAAEPEEKIGAAQKGEVEDGESFAFDKREGGRGQGGRTGKQEQQQQQPKGRRRRQEGEGEEVEEEKQEEGRHERCREVTFPIHFSVEKVDLVPDVCFFREACCPDLDLVGQGLATAATPPPTKPSKGDGPKPGAATPEQPRISTNDSQSPTRPAAGAGQPLYQPPPLPPPPPSSTQCLLALDLFEWLGAVSCGLDAQLRREPSPPEPYLSEFETPRHLQYRRHRTVCRARLRGFLPPVAVDRCVKAAGTAASMATAAAAAAATVAVTAAGAEGYYYSGSGEGRLTSGEGDGQQTDGCSWGSVTVWPFRDAPRAYAGANAPCGGGERTRRKSGGASGGGGRGGRSGVVGRVAREWPVGGHGVYTVVACPGETAVAHVSARCPGPGW